MGGEIFEFKVGIGPFKVNLVALWRRLFLRAKTDPVAVVALRFLQLFHEHGLATTQIPRLIPSVTLEKFQSTELLLSVLTNEVIDLTAALFGVRRAWLEGADSRMYEPLWCYKDPHKFFESLAGLSMPSNGFAVRALFTGKSLDYQQKRRQPIAMVLVEKVQDLGDEEVTRYRVFGDAWDWAHPPCRIQLKAMARLVFLEHHCPVPLHRVKSDLLKKILEGTYVPYAALKGCLLTEPSLEDFALSQAESVKAKETDELPQVLSYVSRHDLHFLAQLPKDLAEPLS